MLFPECGAKGMAEPLGNAPKKGLEEVFIVRVLSIPNAHESAYCSKIKQPFGGTADSQTHSNSEPPSVLTGDFVIPVTRRCYFT